MFSCVRIRIRVRCLLFGWSTHIMLTLNAYCCNVFWALSVCSSSLPLDCNRFGLDIFGSPKNLLFIAHEHILCWTRFRFIASFNGLYLFFNNLIDFKQCWNILMFICWGILSFMNLFWLFLLLVENWPFNDRLNKSFRINSMQSFYPLLAVSLSAARKWLAHHKPSETERQRERVKFIINMRLYIKWSI